MNDKKVRVLDYTLFSILGFFAFMYAEGGRYFATMHVQFGFLNFPIFIGEFLLLICLVLFFIKFYLQHIKINGWYALIIFYFVFVIVKVVIGYAHIGPLAFRDAAMFYYFAFAVIAYHCYRPGFFNRFMILFVYVILAAVFIFNVYSLYWTFDFFILGLILAYSYPERWVGFGMALVMIVITPYHFFIDTARMMILGNFVASIFLIVAGGAFIKRKGIIKYPVILGLVILVALAFFYFSHDKKAQSVLKIQDFIKLFKEEDKIVQAQKPTFKFEDRYFLALYNPEHSSGQSLIGCHLASPADINGSLYVNPKDVSGMAKPDNVVSDNKEVSLPVQKASDATVEKFSSNINCLVESEKRGKRDDLNNGVFRLLIWRDMWEDWKKSKPVFGVDFGKPFRSVSLEILGWGQSEWAHDGWVAAHNSFLNILYRSGLFGVVFIVMFWSVFIWMVTRFVQYRSVVGILLSSMLLNWFVAAHFLVIFELPYTAIPIWILYGITLAYAHRLVKDKEALAANA